MEVKVMAGFEAIAMNDGVFSGMLPFGTDLAAWVLVSFLLLAALTLSLAACPPGNIIRRLSVSEKPGRRTRRTGRERRPSRHGGAATVS